MAYLNTVSIDFFASDLESGKFILVKNQGVGNYVDYEAFGVFAGRGALKFQSFTYPGTPQRIFQIYAGIRVFPPLLVQDGALKLTPPDGWSGKEVRVKVLTKGEAGTDGYILIDIGGSSTNNIVFVIARVSNQMMSSAQQFRGGVPANATSPIYFGLDSWYLVDFQAKVLTDQLILKNVVYPLNLNPDGTFNSLGTHVDVQTLSLSFGSAIPSPNTLWGVNPIEIQGIAGNPVGIWFDNLSIGQGEVITEL
jgi:hypothetical protein